MHYALKVFAGAMGEAIQIVFCRSVPSNDSLQGTPVAVAG